MLKFFRNIRRKLLVDRQLRTYCQYAIGEILLVMIGILLALQVNNWNDARKNRQSFELLLDNIEADLKSNIEESNIGIDVYFLKDSLAQLVLEEKVTKEMYERSPQLRDLLTTGWNYDLIMDNINTLIERGELAPNKYKKLLPSVKSYKSWVENYLKMDPLVRKNIFDNIDYLNNYPWASRFDSSSLSQKIQFFLSDSLYYNQVNKYNRIQSIADGRINRCRDEALVLLAKILLSRKKMPHSKLSSFFQQYGLAPLEQLECQEAIDWGRPFSPSQFRYLVYNNRNTPVQLLVHEINKDPKSITVPPNMNWYIRGIHKIDGNHILELLDAKECRMRFRPVMNGFLLIE